MIPALTLMCSLCTTPSGLPQWETRLGSTSFRRREQASRLLLKTENLHLCRCLLKSNDPEVARRARFVHSLLRSQLLDEFAPYPCLDALLYDVKNRRYMWWEYPNQYQFLRRYGLDPYCSGDDVEWTLYRQATRRWVSDLIDWGVPPRVIKGILNDMHRRDTIAGYGWKVH